MASTPRLADLLRKHQADLLKDWQRELLAGLGGVRDRITETELRDQSAEFLTLLVRALEKAPASEASGPEWAPVRDFLDGISRSRAKQGFSASETAAFVFSLKSGLFARLQQELGSDAAALGRETWTATQLLDGLGLHTAEVYIKGREGVIVQQQRDLLELSTPVVQLWEGILALPLIGTLDSARTQTVMESLLKQIVDSGSQIAILDITGVPTVDTVVAQHLIKTVTAARLMGADCIISGIRPQIAQTIVHLGIDLSGIITKATLAGAFEAALARLGESVSQAGPKA